MWHGRTNRIERPPIADINAIAARLAASGTDLINLGQALLGLPPPPSAVAMAVEYATKQRVHPYSPDPGLPEVLHAVARFIREHKGVDFAGPEHLTLTCGANQAFVNALLTVTNPGDEVVFFGPNYFDHLFAIKLAGCKPVEVPMPVRDGRFVIDFQALEAALTPRTRALIVVSPGNPTGAVVSEGEMGRLSELTAKDGRWLISDETYDLLTFPPAVHVSAGALGLHDRVIVLGSFSKTFGLASWRVGYTLGPPEFIEEAVKVQDAVVVCAPVPSQMAAMGALEEMAAFLAPTLAELVLRRDAMLEVTRGSPFLEPVVPEGATFVFCRLVGWRDSFEFSRKLVEQTGIVTVPGSAFGRYGQGWVRLSFGNQPVARILEAGARLGRLVR